MGTASAILAMSNAFHPDQQLSEAGYSSYAYVLKDTYVTLGGLNFAGGALEWMMTLLYGQGKEEGVSPEGYARSLNEAARVPPGSRGA